MWESWRDVAAAYVLQYVVSANTLPICSIRLSNRYQLWIALLIVPFFPLLFHALSNLSRLHADCTTVHGASAQLLLVSWLDTGGCLCDWLGMRMEPFEYAASFYLSHLCSPRARGWLEESSRHGRRSVQAVCQVSCSSGDWFIAPVRQASIGILNVTFSRDRFLQRAPIPLLHSPAIRSIVDCAIMACSLDHRDANSSVMKFFYDLLHSGRGYKVNLLV